MPGQLEKMKIYAYNNPVLGNDSLVSSADFDNPFVALMNPETYTLETKMEFNFRQGQGTSGSQSRFELKLPEEMSFEFLFDNTGIIDGVGSNGTNDIADKIQKFALFLMGHDGETHEPKFFKLAWGTLIFKGRCTALNINYKLFNPDGKPIRAICKVTFKEFKEENLRVAEEDNQSPDLTHYRVVKKGDTLPMMCYKIYGDSRYYIEIARVNKLLNFRKLEFGQELYFPPLTKTES
jgi:hypothetical protein